ncbi:MAG: leucine-rich repeat protein [Clostridia bacterium]|nr:leucine-rich repeat protein [Clostridia bacterium]
MKKRILLISLMVALFVCLLAFSASAAEPSLSDEYGEVTLISDNDAINNKDDYGYSDGDTARVVVKVPGTSTYLTYPAYYIFDFRDDGATKYGWQPVLNMEYLKNATGLEYDSTCVIRVEIPNFFTAISTTYSKLNTCTSLKSVYMQSNMWLIHGSAFGNLTALESVVFEGSTDSEARSVVISERAFQNCTSLRYLALPANLEATGVASFIGCTSLETIVVPAENRITTISHRSFESCSALTGTIEFENVTFIDTSAFRSTATNEGTNLVLSFPNIVTLGGSSGDTHVFTDSGVKELYFGNTIKNIGFNTFTRCTRLWKAEFAGPVTNFNFGVYTFEDCTALKAFSIPEGITTLPARMFKNCTALTAVYLPSTLATINSGDQEHATFFNCQQMYFVSEPFSLESEASALPAKPDVYFFPTGITSVSTGEIFKLCKSLNKTLVFPTGVTEIANAFAFEAATSDVTLENIVFLGDMTKVATSNNNKYWDFKGKIYFANSADKSSENVALGGISGDVVYCNADGNTTHLQNPNGATSREANCLEQASTFKTCFCGKEYDVVIDETSTALGHIYNLDSITAMVYADYTKDGVITCGCDREGCEGVKAETIKGSYLFTYNGYSRNSKGDMCVGYIVNAEYLECYKTLKQESFSFGLVSTVIDFDDEGVILDGEDKPLAPDYEGKVMSLDLTEKTGFSAYDMIITGFGEAHKDLFLAMNLYVIDGENTSYIWNNAESGTNAVVNYKQYSAIPA